MNVCLIPAAGFGKRLGSPEAKEMLPDPESGRPLIDWSIELAVEAGLRPIVITRREKKTLISHLESHYPQAEIFLIEASLEWPDSILQAADRFGEINLLLLPDTRFAPMEMARRLVEECTSTDVCFATFETEQSLATWGVVDLRDGLKVCEKPSGLESSASVMPWGLIAFRKSAGVKLFEDLLKSNQTHEFFEVGFSNSILKLDWFKDITRDPSDLEPVKSN